MIQKIVLLALAGAVGTLCRYGMVGLVHRYADISFPWGTLVVNVLGCFLAGVLFTIFEQRWQISAQTRVIIFVGFMGAFTTFSAFILETGQLARSAAWLHTAGNMTLQNGVGFLALVAGSALGRMV